MKKKRLLILINILLMVAMLFAMLVACNNNDEPDTPEEPPEDIKPIVLSPSQAMDKVYGGLISGGEKITAMPNRSVNNVFTFNTSVLNYNVEYKANYKENAADSRIYIRAFDNAAHIERLVLYYDGGDLYFRTDGETYVISSFGSIMLFETFFNACRQLDTTGYFFGDTIGSIFNRDSSMNIGLFLSQDNITYNLAGENREVVEFEDVDLRLIINSLNIMIQNQFGGVSDKFDIITQKYFNFKLSRLAMTNFTSLIAESIKVGVSEDVATDAYMKLSVKENSNVYDDGFYIEADVSYAEGAVEIEESADFVKSKCTEATLGDNRFLGSVLIPAVSDMEFNADFITNINSNDNAKNKANLQITDASGTNFFAAYYNEEQAFVDATGFYRWMNGAVDLDAFNLPKIYIENLDLTKLIRAGYSNLSTMVMALLNKNGGIIGEPEDPELYDKILENFGNDGVNTIYYKITEELIKKVSGDDTPLITRFAELIGVDETQLKAFIGEDFFATAELVIAYNLDSGEITVTLNAKGEMVFTMKLLREGFDTVNLPADVRKDNPAYAKFVLPEVITMEVETAFAVRNGKMQTDLSRILGVMIGDPTGKNTVRELKNTETLILRGAVSERYVTDADGRQVAKNSVNLSLYIRSSDNRETLVLNVLSNATNEREMLITYCLPLGDSKNENGIRYRMDRDKLAEGFKEVLGEDNVFDDNNIFSILEKVLGSDGISTVSKLEGWFEFSLMVSGENDPVYELIGIKDTTATVKARVIFTDIDVETDLIRYVRPVITAPQNITVQSIYSDGSAWKESVEIIINSEIINFIPTYEEDSINVVTGKTRYVPRAFLFGQEVSYIVEILDENGTYRIDDIDESILIIDPAFEKSLPKEITVVFDNGEKGKLPCTFEGFYEGNITHAGYNMAGFVNENDESLVKSKIKVGENSIMSAEFDVTILVHNRRVIPVKDSSGQSLYDPDGVAVVGTVNIDPYTFAMRRADEENYNPVLDGIAVQNMELRFDGVYGKETVAEGDGYVEKDLAYDILGINRFNLSELNLDWDYDLSRISYQGSLGYAYAYFGAESGNPVKIAVKVIVTAQHVAYVRIDGESNKYTIDFLVFASYTIPTVTGNGHTVEIFFEGGNSSEQRSRTVSLVRPVGISDEEYYQKYLNVSLDWVGAENIVDNPSVITVNGATRLFGNDNVTTASFGENLGVGVQTVSLSVDVPIRYPSGNGKQINIAKSCEIVDGIPVFHARQDGLSNAKFPAEGGKVYEIYEPYEINPYNAAARLPDNIYLEVNETSEQNTPKIYKNYRINWVTTDNRNPDIDLNLIVDKGDGFGLANPVTYQQDMFVYGKVGDRGGDDGFIWVVMSVRNLASSLTDITYFGFDEGEDTVYVDPYDIDYKLPTGFTATLESGNTITENDIIWYIRKADDENDRWRPAIFAEGYEKEYYLDGKYVFDGEGGSYLLRYVIEGGDDVIRQELYLKAEAYTRTLETDRIDVFDEGGQPMAGVNGIDFYDGSSQRLLDRLVAIADGGNIGVGFREVMPEGAYRPYSLYAQFARKDEDYEHSIDRLIEIMKVSGAEISATLYATVYTGTINERELHIEFNFENRVIDILNFDNYETALRSGAASVEEFNGRLLVFENVAGSRTLNIRLDKPFGITVPDGDGVSKYASPYQYFNYFFGSVTAEFKNGTEKTINPQIDFAGVSEEAFNNALLSGGNAEIIVRKLSAGSAVDELTVVITSQLDRNLGTTAEIPAELFNEDGSEVCADFYALPSYIEVDYEYSGRVRYDVPVWKIDSNTLPYFPNMTETDGIPVRLINTLRKEENSQPAFYSFTYTLPCVNEPYGITVYIPKKNIGETHYTAKGDTNLYDITDGILNITNPYLYYDETAEHGIDKERLPKYVTPDRTSEYVYTDVNEYYVDWEIVGDFSPALFISGAENYLFARTRLPAYYAADGSRQQQEIKLYLNISGVTFSGMSYGRLPVETDASGVGNIIKIDPYDDVMGYRGDFVLPKQPTLSFNGGTVSHTFRNVTYRLRDADGNVFENPIENIPYTQYGHSLNYENLRDDGILELNMYIPGFDAGIIIYVNIMSRVIEAVNIPNDKYLSDGTTETKYLPSIYYIDPYNNATFSLPSSVSVKFRENDGYTDQTVAGWELYDENAGAFVSLDLNKNFYTRVSGVDSTVAYGFYNATADSYSGGNYRLRGYITLGRTSAGAVGRQNFEVSLIVLNRSLKESYETSYRFDDPMGGVLEDIPGVLDREMFVDFNKYYAELGIPEEYYYDAVLGEPIIPEINWLAENDPSEIPYYGGFEKDVNGSIFVENKNTAKLNREVSARVNAQYEELIKARMWDAFFISEGVPQAYYSASTRESLRTLAAKLENEVINATYEITVESFISGENGQGVEYAEYMSDGLILEIAIAHGLNRDTQLAEIIEQTFKDISANEGQNNARGNIYARWKGIYDEFKSSGSDTDGNLTAYRRLKVAKYDEATRTGGGGSFTESERVNYNEKEYSRISRSLNNYIKAAIFDGIYESALRAERVRMSELLRGDDVAAKTLALSAYLNDSLYRLGSSGEKAVAHISAPKYEIGNIIDESGNVVNEFAFNVYTTIAYLAEVDVSVVVNYSDIFGDYIEEGVKAALEIYREDYTEESLTEYVLRKTAEFVNGIVPQVEIPNGGGATRPLNDFTYDNYSSDNNNAQTARNNEGYWNDFYNHTVEIATAHIKTLKDTYKEDYLSMWNNAYTRHDIEGSEDVKAAMNKILAEVNADQTVTDKYREAFARYEKFISDRATAEFDGSYDEALKEIDAAMVGYLLNGDVVFTQLFAGIGGGTATAIRNAFGYMFGSSFLADIYNKVINGFSGNKYRAERAEAEAIYNSNGMNASSAVYIMLFGGSASENLRTRVNDIYNYMLGGAAAFEMLYKNPSAARMAASDLDYMLTAAGREGGIACESDYVDESGICVIDNFDNFRKYVVFDRIRTYYNGTPDVRTVLDGYYNLAVRDRLAQAYEDGIDYFNSATVNRPALAEQMKIARGGDANGQNGKFNIKAAAFVKYVDAVKALGDGVAEEIGDLREEITDRAVFDASAKIVEALLSGDFRYKKYLTPDEDTERELKSAAVELYYKNYADGRQRAVIDYHKALGGDVYGELADRKDMGAAFVDGIRLAYDSVLLQYVSDSVRKEIEDYYSSDAALRGEAAFISYQQTLTEMFRTVINGNILSSGQAEDRDGAAKEKFINDVFAEAMAIYTAEVAAAKNSAKDAADKYAYKVFYDKDGDILDAILNDRYTALKENQVTANLARLNYNAYLKLVELMENDNLTHYYEAAEEVTANGGKAELYSELGRFALKDGAAEDEAKALYDGIYAVYDGLTEQEKALVKNSINEDTFKLNENETYLEVLTEINGLYPSLIGQQGLSVEAQAAYSKLADGIAAAAESALTYVSDGEKYILNAVRNTEGEKLFSVGKYEGRALKVQTAVAVIGILYSIDEMRAAMDADLKSFDNLRGDYSITDEKYRSAFVDGLISALSATYPTAAAYVSERAGLLKKDWFSMSESDEDYRLIEEKILEKLKLTSDRTYIGEETGIASYLAVKKAEVSDFILKILGDKAVGGSASDEVYQAVFDAMGADIADKISFATEDNATALDSNRRLVIFDKSGLIEGSDSEARAPVYLANEAKIDRATKDYSNAHKIDGIIYRYIQVSIEFVDFSGETELKKQENIDRVNADKGALIDNISIDYPELNKMTIDPLAPVLPDKVQAFGTYPLLGEGERLLDLGMVSVTYSDIFYDNIYNGQETDNTGYSINLVDSRGNSASLNIGVAYYDRRVSVVRFETAKYGGSNREADYIDGSEYNGYYNVYDETRNTNVMTINPTDRDIIDENNGAYLLPERMAVRFNDGSEVLYSDVVWDMTGVEFSLNGRTGLNMRVLSYSVAGVDGTVRKVAFDYGANSSVSISTVDADGNELDTVRFDNAPSYDVWNIKLDVTGRCVISIMDENREVIGTAAENGNYIIINSSLYTINPFDIVYPEKFTLTFEGGDTETIDSADWRPEPGNEGPFKIQDIILGQAEDNLVMTNFTYLNAYTVRVRFTADDIEIEGLEPGEFIDGGILYLVRGGGSVFEQLENNYRYLYYNFGTSAYPDYRKVPLSFVNSDISDVSTANVRLYPERKGVLGWDKTNYPDMNMSPNILFTIAIVDPIMYASLINGDGSTSVNPYVYVDYISMPRDGNMQKRNDVNEPDGAGYFVQIDSDGQELYFRIDKDSISYDILNGIVYYNCEFNMTGTNRNLVADGNGGNILTFSVAVPLNSYLYTGVESVTFDKTPVTDASGTAIWKWTEIDERDPEYRDAIVWPLGRQLRASDLPKALTQNGEAISLFWNLDGVNVNRASGAQGYTVQGYYYNSDSVWTSMLLGIIIEKTDVSGQILDALGGSMVINKTYDGNYYRLPLDLNSAAMAVLRSDGRYGALENVTVEYKRSNMGDGYYRADDYPLNAGSYDIRITVDDYNAVINGEFVITLVINPATVYSQLITFENDNNNTVYYTYDGQPKPLQVSGGLPEVTVDNWFASREEKEALVNAYLNLGGYDETSAKSAAYNTLYRNVTAATKRYMDGIAATITDLTGDRRNAAVWDRLEPALKISEVIYTIAYMSGDTVLDGAPLNVGNYTARFTINTELNNGNYVFNAEAISRFIEIRRPEIEYSIANSTLTYNGRLQNPRINGLHDADGRLPAGVTVHYTYSYVENGITHYLTDGITDVGVYQCGISIDGGINYPSETLATATVNMVAQNLYIDIEDAESGYLSPIADLNGTLKFNGLVGADRNSSFGYAEVVTDAKDYYTIGTYGIFFNGFKVTEDSAEVYTFRSESTETIDGKEYYRLNLKGAGVAGSLYTLLNSDGTYAYGELIARFRNYNIFVQTRGDYNIVAEEGAIVVRNDEELQEVLNSVRDAQSVNIYLAAIYDDEGNIVPYSAVTINANAEISVIGSYDSERNIITPIEGVTVSRGAVTLRILEFSAKENGAVGLTVGADADSISVYDCKFDGCGYQYTSGIKIDANYGYKVYVQGSYFKNYERGINLLGGNLELGGGVENGNVFENNNYGVSIIGNGTDVRIADSEFIGQKNAGVYSENTAAVIINNNFDRNFIGVHVPEGNAETVDAQNTFGEYNGANISTEAI